MPLPQFHAPIRFMNNLEIKYKFIIMGVVVLIPMLVFMLMNIQHSTKTIAFTKNEQIGIEFIAPVRQMIQQVQVHRGMSNAYLAGKTALKPKIDEAEQKAEKALQGVLVMQNRYGDSLATENRLAKIQAD